MAMGPHPPHAPWYLLLLLAALSAHSQGSAADDTGASGGGYFWQPSYPSGFFCPAQVELDGGGLVDVSAKLVQLDAKPAYQGGITFLSKGRYRIARSIKLFRPIQAAEGAVLVLDAGVVITLNNLAVHPPSLFFDGKGTVTGLWGTLTLPVEWFGAKGDGRSDDAAAIQRALDAADGAHSSVVFAAGRTYAIGTALQKSLNAAVFAGAGSALRALKPKMDGVVFGAGGHRNRDVLPALLGFKGAALVMRDVGLSDVYVPLIADCGDGVRMQSTQKFGGQFVSAGVAFGTMRDCVRGIVMASLYTRSVMQGTDVRGLLFQDTKGASTALLHFEGNPAWAVGDKPYWDSNSFQVDRVTPHPAASRFALLRSDVKATLARQNLFVPAALGVLPRGGKLVDVPALAGIQAIARHTLLDNTLRVKLTAPFLLGQLDMSEVFFNSFQFVETFTAGKTFALAAAPNSRAAFNGGTPLFSNRFTVTAKAAGAWKAGTSRVFYLYHMLAQGRSLTYMTVPGAGAGCLPSGVMVAGLYDNSGVSPVPNIKATPYEITITLTACRALPAGAVAAVPLLVGMT